MNTPEIDIVDRLTVALEEVSREKARLHEFTSESLPVLIMQARDEIHMLQGLVFAYPPSGGHHGVTWREEYETLRERFIGMSAEDFADWQSVMRD